MINKSELSLNDRIDAFAALGTFLQQFESTEYKKVNNIKKNDDFFDPMVQKIISSKNYNGWFSEENVVFALSNWAKLLTKSKLEDWVAQYNLAPIESKNIGLIMAGNIPLVGFHDFLSVLISGHKARIKLSSNDQQLLPLLAEYLIAIAPEFKERITFIEGKLEGFDAIIATGSNNTARYFEYYFKNVPNIIRKNRNSIAVLDGSESQEQLTALGEDIFRYYGLGCRSVSKIYVPRDYNFDNFFQAIYAYKDIINGDKYANNYDYNKAVYLMSNYQLLENGFLILKEDKNYSSPIASLFYEYYDDIKALRQSLAKDQELIQCIVSNRKIPKSIDFGQTQQPSLTDYADGIDIIEFLTKNTRI